MLGLTDGLSLLILRSCEPLEDTLIAALRADNEIKKKVLYNSVTCNFGSYKNKSGKGYIY